MSTAKVLTSTLREVRITTTFEVLTTGRRIRRQLTESVCVRISIYAQERIPRRTLHIFRPLPERPIRMSPPTRSRSIVFRRSMVRIQQTAFHSIYRIQAERLIGVNSPFWVARGSTLFRRVVSVPRGYTIGPFISDSTVLPG